MYGEHGGTGEDQFRSPYAMPVQDRRPLPPREVVFPGKVQLPQPDADPEPPEEDPEHILREKKLKRLSGLLTPERRRRAAETIRERTGRVVCSCDPGPEGQHQWYCGVLEVISDEDVPPGTIIVLDMNAPPPAEPYQPRLITDITDESIERMRQAIQEMLPPPPQRCPSCTYLLTSPSHAVMCG